MPSPMDECDNVVNIDTSTDQTVLKRKLDGNSDELSFPCKKVAMAPIPKLPSPEGTTIPPASVAAAATSPTTNAGTQVKLTKAEREWFKMEKAKEREAERQKREEEKQKREEEKQKREEERAKKQTERDEAKRKREAEKEEARKEREKKEQEKEEQRRKKEEEIEKKNKAQLRLNNFFSVPKKKTESPTPPVESISDYQRYFQPFHVRQDVVVAPLHHFVRGQSEIQTSTAVIDSVLAHPDPNLPPDVLHRLHTLIPACSSRPRRGRTFKHTVKELISLINENPDSTSPYRFLKQIPRKHLQYAEDVRPAYNGTFTRRTKLTPRNPFKRDPDTFAYDYDSEAEWEFEPEDGENLDDESNADDDEMGSMMGDSGDEEDRAFLDDEDEEDGATKTKGKSGMGKRFAAPLLPVIKGVCWETNGVQRDEVLAGMRATRLLFDGKGDSLDESIDPFSSKYWVVAEMLPPPAPKLDSQIVLMKIDASGSVEAVKTSVKPKSAFPDALLVDFLKAIQGTTYNQLFLIELLKKRFPTATKGGITDKLKEVAFRTGRKDTDHWEIRKEFLSVIGQ